MDNDYIGDCTCRQNSKLNKSELKMKFCLKQHTIFLTIVSRSAGGWKPVHRRKVSTEEEKLLKHLNIW